jgi:tetratricopeptide (TPR) repeat protein
MINDVSNIPKELIDALREKDVVLFIGSGVSRAVEKKDKDPNKPFNPLFPSWGEFVGILAAALREKNKSGDADYVLNCLKPNPPKYLDAMQHAFEQLGKNRWYEVFDETYNIKREKADDESLEAAQIVWELSNNLVITTNVDLVLQWSCPNPNPPKILDAQIVEYGQLQKEKEIIRPTIWHLHGHIDNKERVIFTKQQYEAFYNEKNNEAKLRTLLTFLTQRTFLFIGFSLDDPYFLKQLEYIHQIYGGAIGSFYVLLNKSEEHKPNIPDYVEKIIYKNYGKPFLELLRRLGDLAKSDDEKKIPPTEPVISNAQTASPKDALKNHFNVPFASKGEAFVGRDGLREKIWESLSRSGRAAIGQAVSIKGIGGLGKTQLAVEYAHAYRHRYENGVFWLTADEDINIQLIKIGENLSWISQFDTGFDQAELVRNRFRKLSDCLIIFDNVDERKAIENYLPESGAQAHILITSREKQSGFYQIELELLERDEARALLLNVAERNPEGDAETENFERILDELEDLPLAVELVGGYLSEHPTVTFEKYYGFLQAVPLDKLEAQFPDDSFTHHDKSIIRTLKISEKLLETKPLMVEILDVLAWSGKSSMGNSLLRALVEADDEFDFENSLSEAVKLRLIKQEEKAERYAIHRLVARVRRFEKPLAGRKEWHQKIVGKLIEWFRQRKDEFEYLAEFENETIHLQQWQSQSVDVLPIEAVYLTDFESYPLWHRGNYRESKSLLEKALNLYQENQLNDEKLLANLYNDLGVITRNLGNINQGFEFHQKALLIGRSVFDEKSEDIAKFLNNLGYIYGELENHQKALELQEQALTMQRELFGEKHPDIARSLNNLGYTYSKLGNHQKALELKEQALKMRQELFGEKHPDIALSLNNLGSIHGKLNNHQKALELKEQALKMRQELFGEKHPDIALSLNNLAYTYDILNNKQKATNFYESALKMRRELLGEKHPDTISTCGNLIQTLSELGKRAQAGRLAGEFLSYVPQNHPDRWFFEEYGAAYRKASKKKKRRGR